MRVAITGGTGFIGRALVARLLARGDSVRVLSRSAPHESGMPAGVEIFQGDLTGEPDSLIPFLNGVDVLYHCAGEIRDQEKMEALHIEGTRNLCAAAAGRVKHWVQLSSTGVYGPHKQGVVTEETLENPVGVYEKTKARADEIVREMAVKGGFTWSILRPSIVYGPGMPNQSLFQLISMIKKGFFFYIGKGKPMVNYLHVENVVSAMMAAEGHTEFFGRIYILSQSMPLQEMVQRIAARFGGRRPALRLPEGVIRFLARLAGVVPGFPLTLSRVDALTSEVVYDGEQAQRDLEYIRIPLARGIEQLVDHWLECRVEKRG